VIYLDSSAVIKLIHLESETEQLNTWLSDHRGMPMMTSDLTRVEVHRATVRLNSVAFPAMLATLDKFAYLPMTRTILNQAATLGDPLLRTLDALHLASAISIRGDLAAVVTYDHRMASAASTAGLFVARPGQDL